MSASVPAAIECPGAGDAGRPSKGAATRSSLASIERGAPRRGPGDSADGRDAATRRHPLATNGRPDAPAATRRRSSTTTIGTPVAPPPTREPATDLDDSRLTCLVGYAASRASIELKKSFARHIGPFDVKASEFSILMLLAANADVNQKQLGAALDISPPNMAVTLDRMVGHGWVERVRSTRDRRAQQIHLTGVGRELVRQTEKISRSMEQSALQMLSGAERALLIELLLKVAAGARAAVRTG